MASQFAMLVTAMASVVATWGLLFAAFTGIGLLALGLLRLRAESAGCRLRPFWIGWALVLFLLQVWHLWTRVDWRALAVALAMGMVGLLWHRRELWHLVSQGLRKEWLFCLVILVLALRLANRAVGPSDHIDAGYYHFSAIRWAEAYPVVPGLGNLHCPLGINSAHFLYVAMLDAGPWHGRGHHLANGLLLLAALMQAVASVFAVCRRPSTWRPSELFLALSMPALWMQAAFDPSRTNELFIHLIPSPTPDLPVFVLGVVMAAELLALLEAGQCGQGEGGLSAFTIAALAAAGTVVKLSFAVFAAATLLVAAAVLIARKAGERGPGTTRPLVLSAAIVVTALAPWLGRSVILSGYVAYPVPAGSLNVDWRMPREVVAREAAVVQGQSRFAAQPGGWRWIVHWAGALLNVASGTVVVPCALVLCACCLALYWKASGGYARRTPRVLLLFFAPIVLGVAFWFFTAPSPRFAGSLFCIAAAGTFAVAADALKQPMRKLATWFSLGLSVALSVVVLARTSVIGPGTDHGFHPIPEVTVVPYVTRSGLKVFVPSNDILCWDAPLPCTPFPKPGLRLRVKDDLSAGFTLDLGAGEGVRELPVTESLPVGPPKESAGKPVRSR